MVEFSKSIDYIVNISNIELSAYQTVAPILPAIATFTAKFRTTTLVTQSTTGLTPPRVSKPFRVFSDTLSISGNLFNSLFNFAFLSGSRRFNKNFCIRLAIKLIENKQV